MRTPDDVRNNPIKGDWACARDVMVGSEARKVVSVSSDGRVGYVRPSVSGFVRNVKLSSWRRWAKSAAQSFWVKQEVD